MTLELTNPLGFQYGEVYRGDDRGPYIVGPGATQSEKERYAVIHPIPLDHMRKRGGRWAAYQNIVLDSSTLGRLIFLPYGSGGKFDAPPHNCPDTRHDSGWKYTPIGYVNLEKATIEAEEQTPFEPRESPV